MQHLYDCIKYIQKILYPPTCLLCGAPGSAGLDLCAGCAAEIPAPAPACRLCARPLPQPGTCGACLRHPPPQARTVAPLPYAGAVRELITGLKFRHRLAASRLLGTLLAQALEGDPERPELLLPVPLHPARLRERGFNQALEIARPVGRLLGIDVARDACRRIRDTPHQMGLHERERRRNVRGAFSVADAVSGRHVAVLDDVITTGSTAAELVRALQRAGAERVDVWAVARTGER